MAQILIVDDEAAVRQTVRRTLERAGHAVAEAGDVNDARSRLKTGGIELVFCDITMPGESGLELLQSLDGTDIAVVMLTGVDDPQVASRALASGAYAYLVKPVGPNEVLINVASALRRRELELDRRAYVQELESKITRRGRALHEALSRLDRAREDVLQIEHDAVKRLVTALTVRSEETGAHIQRVGRYSELLAAKIAAPWPSHQMRLAAMLHDVGKLGVPDSILLKPGPLDEQDREIIRHHPALGASLLAGGSGPLLKLAAEIALTHHERWDGSGYPAGLAATEIPLAGRIVAVADVFDALTSDRVYRAALPRAQAIAIMRVDRGRHFDPAVLDAFLASRVEIEAIMRAHPDTPLSGPPEAGSRQPLPSFEK